ncbi:TonB-dependent receptor [Chitinophaga horti]|uniref:TonB-dependent receptor n=1 Tax=Chitinophaga horti TaxID=2920382 RepID=A0ABY6J349_9BACT|nr:outer membrane beta-barrel protein [Chitinophaga horti]UYQ94080.1 TonB-dependent receptor [Chitinophaga horti]
MRTTIILLALLCFGMCMPLFAQQRGKVSVKVLDEAGKPLPYAGVAVKKSADSALLKGQMSDADGKTQIDQLPAGRYFVQVTQMGYAPHNTTAFDLGASQQLELPNITMRLSSKNLKEVNVTGQKPFVERTEGKTVLNVESSVAAAGNSVMDLLRRAPGVSVDNSDNLSVRGKSGVTVMLDGKLTYLSNEALAELLKSMPAETVSQIEIITSPSARYDAAGSSGIINIKTKKGQLTGLNGTANANVGAGRYWFYGIGGSVNWRTKRFNAFGTVNYGDRQSYNTRELHRITGGAQPTQFRQDVYQTNDFLNRSYKAGVDFFITPKQTIGVLTNASYNAFWRNAPSATKISNKGAAIDSILHTSVRANNRFSNTTYNLNYKLKPDTLGTEFTIDADYAHFHNNMRNNLADSMVQVSSSDVTQRSAISMRPYTYIDIYSIKSDLVLPLSKTIKVEAGVKASFVKVDNYMRYDSLLNGEYVPVASQYDQFKYNENVYAAYFVYKQQFKKTDFTLGLRAEHTEADANSISLKNRIKRNYLNWFPNFTADHKFSENHKLSLAYSKRINRPGYGMLNPFYFFLDKFTFFRGNSYLTPEYTHNTELSYIFKTKYIVSLASSVTTDLIDEYLIQNDKTKITVSTNRNLGTQVNYALNLTAPFDPAKWWNINSNGAVYHTRYQIRDTTSTFYTRQLSWNLNITNTFTLPADIKIELGAWYEAPTVYGIFKSQAMGGVWGGIQKEIMKKKATLKLNVQDIFATNRFRGTADYGNVYLRVNNRWQNRTANLSFTYRFGNTKIEGARERKTGSEEEANRAG